ncbi:MULTISPECIES: stage II sporulation protein M [unclassified Virgibacillus]|uniref:stage II sporulation protein M n=1 Tax=unclassified Virgibacillus TaxID=2620237 RepID=UPI0024DECD9A|nr:stage II sporulation protein M [Virgibacillus sp. LDC-1]
MYSSKGQLLNHFREHATIYVFMIILFVTGVIFGAVIVNSMNVIQKQELFFYLEKFFGQIASESQISSSEVFKNSFLYHAKYLLLLFILGLSIIGLPIVWILLFIKGLVVGFTVGFLVNQLGMEGFLLASFSIAPQNFIIIPVYIIAGSLSMIFSLILLNKLFSRRVTEPVLQPFGKYLSVYLGLFIFAMCAGALEAFVANEAMSSFIQSYFSK